MSSIEVFNNAAINRDKNPLIIPEIVASCGERTSYDFVEFFLAHIENKNTRLAYARAVRSFLLWCEGRGVTSLRGVNSLMVAAWLQQHSGKPATVNQQISAIRELFRYLHEKGHLDKNPAAAVKGRKHRVKEGKTPVLEDEEIRLLLDVLDCKHPVRIRDRALIGLMLFTFARVGAVVRMRQEDYFYKGKRAWVRLHEKGGTYLELPLHPTAESYLDSYLDALRGQTNLDLSKETPLFRSARGKTQQFTSNPLHEDNAYAMVKVRLKEAGIRTDGAPHSFRAGGITNYLTHGGSLDRAQHMAGHSDIRTTRLYDRRRERISYDEVLRIRF